MTFRQLKELNEAMDELFDLQEKAYEKQRKENEKKIATMRASKPTFRRKRW